MLYEFMAPFEGKIEEYGQQQFSQYGEDVALWAWVEILGLMDKNGFYIDVGAHHPVRGSNTYLLRKILGWSGVNIEPDPQLFSEFLRACPECVNLQIAIGDKEGNAELTIYNHPGANTISDALRVRQAADSRMEVVRSISVPMRPLSSVISEFLPKDKDFRLLTVDAEGLDFDVIKSFDIELHRPNLIMIEDFDMNLTAPMESPIFRHLSSADYIPVSHCMVTTIYRKKR